MAEQLPIPEYNGNAEPEIIPVHITDIIDQLDTSVTCETRECDSVFTSTEETNIHLQDKAVTLVVDTNNEKSVEDQKVEMEALPIPEAEPEAQKEGDSDILLDIASDTPPATINPGNEELNYQEVQQDQVKAETPDILLCNQTKNDAETAVEDPLTEEENASTETDNENGEGSLDEYELRPISPGDSHLEYGEEQLVSGKRPDISRHSYSRYDTVSYRKIRRGNTKQRIDEFESMMNL